MSHSGLYQANTIPVLEIMPEDTYELPTNSVYDKCLAKTVLSL